MPVDDKRYSESKPKVEGSGDTMGKWLVGAISEAWRYLNSFLGFLRDSTGKFSHKRLLALALGVVMIFLLFQHEWWGAGISGLTILALSVISAVTRT